MFKGNVKKARAALARFGKKAAVVPLAAGVMVSNALAALPTEVTTEFAGSKTDVKEAGGLAFGIFLAIILFVWLRRVTR